MTATTTGPDLVSFQVRDREASARFYEETVGLKRLHNEDATELHARLVEQGVPVVQEPTEGPFGFQFAFSDPDGYLVTIHSQA